jgi:polyisoprenoid-binding protein YceI
VAVWFPLLAQETVLQLDPEQTQIKFTLVDVLHTVHGTFKLKSGTFRFDPATHRAGGEIIVDVQSGDSGNKSRDKRLHKEVLESEKYPEAVFTPDRYDGEITSEGDSKIEMHGTFRVHGEEHEMTVPADIHKQGGTYTSDSHFVIPYVKWGMKNPSTLLLKVEDKAQMDVHAVAQAGGL